MDYIGQEKKKRVGFEGVKDILEAWYEGYSFN